MGANLELRPSVVLFGLALAFAVGIRRLVWKRHTQRYGLGLKPATAVARVGNDVTLTHLGVSQAIARETIQLRPYRREADRYDSAERGVVLVLGPEASVVCTQWSGRELHGPPFQGEPTFRVTEERFTELTALLAPDEQAQDASKRAL